MRWAPTEAELPAVEALARRRFGTDGYGLEAGGLVGTPGMVVEQLQALQLAVEKMVGEKERGGDP